MRVRIRLRVRVSVRVGVRDRLGVNIFNRSKSDRMRKSRCKSKE